MKSKELRAKARQQLGSNLFCPQWLSALAVCAICSLALGAISMIPVVGGLASLILYGPLMLGYYTYFTEVSRNGSPSFKKIFCGFEDFGGNLVLYLMMTLFIFLWSLLFVIPGIVKAFSYSMAFYIKHDHPEYGWKQCIDESRRLMKGRKAKLFWLYLSFIGWHILCAFTFGIGSLWLAPYIKATEANFYNMLVSEDGKAA